MPADRFETIFRRDLDRLPALPDEELVPSTSDAHHGSLISYGATIVAVVMVALIAGVGLRAARDVRPVEVSAVGSPPAPVGSVVGVVPRELVLGRVRQLTQELPRIDRIGAKLVEAAALRRVNPELVAPVSEERLWLVGVVGDVRCGYCLVPPMAPLRSALYALRASTGDPVASVQSPDVWSGVFPPGVVELSDLSTSTCLTPLAGSVADYDGDGVSDCFVLGERAAGVFLSFVSGARTQVEDLGQVSMLLAQPSIALYAPKAELPIAVVVGAIGANAGEASVYQWRNGRMQLLLRVEGSSVAQSDESGRPLLRVLSSGQARVYGWNGSAFVQR
jgi:hypothetical protein